jgi:predicted short-subunit dehydrogenase-like oxidoreductase (DUF2520 family)
VPTVRIVGPGRAGSSLADALAGRGWVVAEPVGHYDDPTHAAKDVDLCVIATPDDAIAATARRIEPHPTTVVAHLSGSRGIEVLEPHPRTAALHPLASLPDRATGSRRLADKDTWWAVEGDPLAKQVVEALGGRIIDLPPGSRTSYHAAACIAANHLVTLMAQVERVTAAAGLPVEPFYDLAAAALGNARATGAQAALTGPAARGDRETIDRHLAAIDAREHRLYLALADAAGVLACK